MAGSSKKTITLNIMHLGSRDVLIGIQVNLIDSIDTDKIVLITDKVEKDIIGISQILIDNISL